MPIISLPRSTPSKEGVDCPGRREICPAAGGNERRRTAQLDDPQTWRGRRGRLVVPLYTRATAAAVLAQQELHVHCRRTCSRRRTSATRRCCRLVLSRAGCRDNRHTKSIDARASYRRDEQWAP